MSHFIQIKCSRCLRERKTAHKSAYETLNLSLSEICDYGEREYYSMLHQLTATPQSMKFQLWDMGIDYTTLTPYQLFYNVLFKLFTQEKTSIIFGDLDFTKFEYAQRKDNGDILLIQLLENGDSYDEVKICKSH